MYVGLLAAMQEKGPVWSVVQFNIGNADIFAFAEIHHLPWAPFPILEFGRPILVWLIVELLPVSVYGASSSENDVFLFQCNNKMRTADMFLGKYCVLHAEIISIVIFLVGACQQRCAWRKFKAAVRPQIQGSAQVDAWWKKHHSSCINRLLYCHGVFGFAISDCSEITNIIHSKNPQKLIMLPLDIIKM